jgi:hypothetical protein
MAESWLCSRLLLEEHRMPITSYLDGQQFDPETKRVMDVAFEIARAALHLNQDHPTIAIVARKIIELANAGQTNPDLLSEQALASLSYG